MVQHLHDPTVLGDRFPLPLDRPFTSSQARRAGVTADRLTSLVELGTLRRLLRGVYVASQMPDSRELRARALALVAPAGSVVCDWTACWYWSGIEHPSALEGIPPLSVYRFRGHTRLRQRQVRSGERWFLPSDVVPLEERLLVARPLRTAWDLGRFYPRVVAIGGMDALARTGAFTVPELCDGVERFKRQRGVVQLRGLAPLVEPRSESTGESALRLRWTDMGHLPRPEVQIEVRRADGRVLYRIDAGVEALRFGAEYDGERWHSSSQARAHDEHRRRVLNETYGWVIEVFRRDDVFGPHETVTSRLPAALFARTRAVHSTRRR